MDQSVYVDSCDERVYYSPPGSPELQSELSLEFPLDEELPSYQAATGGVDGFEFDDGLDEIDTAAPFKAPARPPRYVAAIDDSDMVEMDTVTYARNAEDEQMMDDTEEHFGHQEEEEEEEEEEDDDGTFSVIREQVSWQKERSVMKRLYRDQPRLEAGDLWYLIDATWYRKWKRFVQWDTMIPRSARPGPIDNSPLLEDTDGDGESMVRANALEMTDFYIITDDEWSQLHAWYGGGPEIKRPVIATGAYSSSLSVEYRPLHLYVVKSSDIDNPVECYYSKATPLKTLVDEMCQKLNIDPNEIRVWDYHGDTRAKHLTKMERTLTTSNIIDRQKILFEEKDEDGDFPEKPKPRAVSYNTYSSGSSWNRWGQQEPQPPGLCGLTNLGNTCFMNSSLQSLSNTVPLTAYFLSGRYKEDIDADGENPLSTGGKLAEQYAELLRCIWEGTRASIAPREFKSKLERFAPQFAGYQQHDSQELLAFLLDGLHEDLNKKKKDKPYVEATEHNGRPDDVVAAEAWANHRLRNDSIIVDWFQGQLKSCVTCPDCDNVSVTFDPCMYFSLPLPMKTTRKIKITFVPLDGSVPTRFKVTVTKFGTISDLKKALIELAELPADTNLVVAEIWTNQFYQVYHSSKTTLDSIQENDILFAYQLGHDISEEEEEEDNDDDRQGRGYGYSSYPRYSRQEKEKDVMKISVLHRKIEIVERRSYYSSTYTRKTMFGPPLIISVRKGETYDDVKRRIMSIMIRFIRVGVLEQDRAVAEEEKAARAAARAQAKLASSAASDSSIVDNNVDAGEMTDSAEGLARSSVDGQEEDAGEEPIKVESQPEGITNAVRCNNVEDEDYSQTDSDSSISTDSEESMLRESAETERNIDDDEDDEDDEYDEVDDLEDTEEDAEEEDDQALSLFTMQITDKSGQTDYSILLDDDKPLGLRDKQTISLNWDLDAIKRYYVEAEETHIQVHESVNAEEPQLKKTVSLQDCFEIFSAEEELGPEDQVYCSKCKEFRQSTKKMDIWRLPPILVIHLKRFSYKNRYYREKLDTLVEFPLSDLDLSSQQLADTANVPAVYDLMAVSNHFGSLGGGHYTAFAKHVNDGMWYKFDDSHVSKADESSVCSTAAYVLFYRRKDTLDWNLGVPTPMKYVVPEVEDDPEDEPVSSEPEEEQEEEEVSEDDADYAEDSRDSEALTSRAAAAEPPSDYEFQRDDEQEESDEEEEEEEDEGSFELVGQQSDSDEETGREALQDVD